MKLFPVKAALILIGVAMLSGTVGSETAERIVAVVGDRVILASELAGQVQMYMLSLGENSGVDPQRLARDVLGRMINDELILSAARDDSTITVPEEEIRAGLDEHIASLAARFPSEQAFLDQLQREGMTKRTLEKRYHPQIRDQLLKQRIITRKLSKVSVSRQEVEDFFTHNRDSLPPVPGKIRLAHILVKFKVSPQTDDSVRQVGEEARRLAVQGKDLGDVATELTPRFPGIVGGRVGFIQREEVVAEFGRAAFSLQAGDISGLVRTEYGYHIIKSHARFKDSVDVSQILLPLAPSPADTLRAKAAADSLHRELQNGADFRELAKRSSEDDSTRGTGGELLPMTDDQLRPEFVEPLNGIDTGQITMPVLSQAGYHILRLLEREKGHPLSLTQDYDILRNIAKQDKTGRLVEEWVSDLKKKVYVDIRDASLR